MNWLFKEEPTHYGFDAFVKDRRTVWSGVKNPVAQKHLRAVRKGDVVFTLGAGDITRVGPELLSRLGAGNGKNGAVA